LRFLLDAVAHSGHGWLVKCDIGLRSTEGSRNDYILNMKYVQLSAKINSSISIVEIRVVLYEAVHSEQGLVI
jgi:hypothetical protein